MTVNSNNKSFEIQCSIMVKRTLVGFAHHLVIYQCVNSGYLFYLTVHVL